MPCKYTGPFNPGSGFCPCAACQCDRDWEKAQDELADRCALTDEDVDKMAAEQAPTP